MPRQPSAVTRERIKSLPAVPLFAGGVAATGQSRAAGSADRLTLGEALGATRPVPNARPLSYKT
eukprot:6440045-Alexandrium_andersonii.AAC.1